MGRNSTVRILLVLAVALGVFAAPAAAQRSKFVGKTFPNFDFKDPITGKKHDLKDFRGKVVLIDFWATWCGPCVRELPNVKSVYKKYKDDGFEIISISLDNDRSKFKSFVARQKMKWPHVMDGGGWSTRLAKKYSIRSIPAMFVIDHEGTCISDSARGHQLERIVRSAVSRIPADVLAQQDEQEDEASDSRSSVPRPLDRELASKLLKEVADASGKLNAADAPLSTLHDRLAVLRTMIDGMDAELPPSNSRDAKELVRRARSLDVMLREIRGELFVCGFVTDPPALPAVAPADGANMAALVVVKQRLQPARESVALMSEAVQQARGDASELLKTLGLQSYRLRRDMGDVATIRATCADATDLAAQLETRCADPWKGRLRDAESMVAAIAAPVTKQAEQLDGLDARIAEIRRSLVSAGNDLNALTEMRTAMDAVVKDVTALAAGMDDAMKVPVNPLGTGNLRDMRARVEADQQLKVAERVIKRARGDLADAESAFDDLRSEVKSMTGALADAGDDRRKIESVRESFTDWSLRLLTLRDGIG